MKNKVTLESILKAKRALNGLVVRTPTEKNSELSESHGYNVYLKREDQQKVRSYKIRGAVNFVKSIDEEQRQKGIVCASAGNHAQGIAYVCNKLDIDGTIFMPRPTPMQKRRQTERFGKDNVNIMLEGDDFDESCIAAKKYCKEHGKTFVHPFDDARVISGQGTIGVEILEDLNDVHYILVPVGGGGLISGIGAYVKSISPGTKIIGVEPEGAASMKKALDNGGPCCLDDCDFDIFVDGVAVKQIGELPYSIAKEVVDDMIVVPEGKVCTTIMSLYNNEGIVAEPAGALSIAALDYLPDDARGKNVVCILSGSNNDIARMQEIQERSLIYEGLKHYFIVNMPQRPGALMEFLQEVLGPDDDIAHFEYTKKQNKEKGPVLIGIELRNKGDYEPLLERMQEKKIEYKEVLTDELLRDLLI
ncbi:threonine ammonia-lyase IlvA [candidate division KSB1 bacterium]